jgi:hypothetical protein
MRRSPRTLLLALLVAVVALGGCGGSEIDADEVPGATPTLTVPSDSELNSGSTSDEDAASTDEDAATTEDAAAEDTTADTEAAAPADETTGGTTTPAPTATAAPQDSAETDTPPPAGSEAQQFEDFCAQNAGAC